MPMLRLFILGVLCAIHAAPAAEALPDIETPSYSLKTSSTGLWLSGYTQKREWNDRHDLMLDFASIMSVNVFRDEQNPRISITSTERMIDSGLVENRIYWIALKNTSDLDILVSRIWSGKSVHPIAETADDF
jgi:hypothetical protein